MITINSLTIRFLNKIYRVFSDSYKDSFTKKSWDFIKNPIEKIFQNSKTREVLAGDKILFENTFIYKIYSKLFNFIERFMNFLGRIFLVMIKNSFFLGGAYKSLDSFDEIAGLLSNIIFYSGILTLVISLIFKASLYIPLAFIIFGLILSLLKGRYMEIIMGSKFIEFFTSFFKLDEGGENWW